MNEWDFVLVHKENVGAAGKESDDSFVLVGKKEADAGRKACSGEVAEHDFELVSADVNQGADGGGDAGREGDNDWHEVKPRMRKKKRRRAEKS